jgi:hypothetical protein
VATGPRITAIGSAGALVIAGVICLAAISGTVGQLVGFVLISLGLVLATSLVFLEVGLSEDRERARAERRAERAERRQSQPRSGRWLDRMRGRRRGLD